MEELKSKQGITLRLSWHFLVALLLITNLVTVFLWKPWSDSTTATRKISVSGQATIKAEPDEYALYPYFEFTNADRTKATEELTKLSTDTTAKLKEIGVKDEQIKSSTNGYDRYNPSGVADGTNTLQLQYTVTVNDKDIAQKVQDYFLSIKAKGQISPQASFSVAKQKELEGQARDKAIADAKEKANKTAKELNAKVGKVITISDGTSYGGPIAYSIASDVSAKSAESSSVPVQAGQNEYSFNVSVEYELK